MRADALAPRLPGGALPGGALPDGLALAWRVAWILALPPLLLMLRWVSGVDAFAAVFAAAQAAAFTLALALAMANAAARFVGRMEWAYVAFMGALLLGSLAALPRFPELEGVPMFGPWLMFVLWSSPLLTIPALFTRRDEVRALLRGVEWLGVPLALTVFLPLVGIEVGEVQSSEGTGLTRVFGLFGDSIAPVMAFYLVLSVATGAYARAVLYAAAVLVTVGLGAMTCSAVAFAVLAFGRLRAGGGGPWGARRWAGLVLGAIVTLAVAGAAGQSLYLRLSSAESVAFTVAQRVGSYLSALAVFEDNPWLGVGYTGLRAVTMRYRPEGLFAVFSENAASTASNQLLQTATDAGVLGLLALVALLASGLAALRRARGLAAAGGDARSARWFAGAFAWSVGMVVGYQTGVWLLPHSLLPFLFFVGLGAAAAYVRAEAAPEPGAA